MCLETEVKHHCPFLSRTDVMSVANPESSFKMSKKESARMQAISKSGPNYLSVHSASFGTSLVSVRSFYLYYLFTKILFLD